MKISHRRMEQLFTIREVAKILKTNVNFVYDEIDKGNIPHVLIGPNKVRQGALEEYIRSREKAMR